MGYGKWGEKFSPSERRVTEKEVSLDNNRTTTPMKRVCLYNPEIGRRATLREWRQDGKTQRIILELEDATGIYEYNSVISPK